MRPAIREVELVDELLTKGQRVQLGGGTINESLIEVIEFGLPNPPAAGEHEPIQLRAISTSERAINRISKSTDAVRTALANIRPGRGQNSSPRPLTSSNRIDDHVRATTSNAAGGYDTNNCHTRCRDYRVRLPSDRLALYTGPADRSRPTIEEHQMADNRLSEKFDALSDKAKESANKLKATGGREKDQLKADAAAARERATATADQFEEKVVEASERASSQWDEVRGKWKAHVAKVRSSIEAKMDEQDAKAAALDADLAEDYALDAISFAQGAIEEAEAASLDAVYARANAVALGS